MTASVLFKLDLNIYNMLLLYTTLERDG